MRKITPCLWFDGQAEEAANLYVSIFKNARIVSARAVTVAFELDGAAFTAINGGPMFKFTEAVSFQVSCADQAEVDHFWDKLSAGGETSRCGWLKDRFGLSWQVIPAVLPQLLGDPDPARARRAMEAMLKMTKLDIAALRAAAEG
jgi:predicted 3-demethylubiquinone-9 3-methyltransferase (glyoxalase superfamily)